MSDIIFDGENVKVDGNNIILEGEYVTIDGRWFKSQTWDLMLDAPDRRLFPDGNRRAMVHDPNDRLTINYAGDYPNGVQIQGKLVVDSLFVRGTTGFASGIRTPSITVLQPLEPALVKPGGPLPGGAEWGVELIGKIQRLEEEISLLKDRVAKLESGNP